MKKYVDGMYVAMTEEEIASLQQQETPKTEKTIEERLAALEALLAERGNA